MVEIIKFKVKINKRKKNKYGVWEAEKKKKRKWIDTHSLPPQTSPPK